MEYPITHYPQQNRFDTIVEGETAHVEYRLVEESLDIIHTIVPKPLAGRGVAAALVKEAYRYAIANKLKPKATCPYAIMWLQRHPQ